MRTKKEKIIDDKGVKENLQDMENAMKKGKSALASLKLEITPRLDNIKKLGERVSAHHKKYIAPIVKEYGDIITFRTGVVIPTNFLQYSGRKQYKTLLISDYYNYFFTIKSEDQVIKEMLRYAYDANFKKLEKVKRIESEIKKSYDDLSGKLKCCLMDIKFLCGVEDSIWLTKSDLKVLGVTDRPNDLTDARNKRLTEADYLKLLPHIEYIPGGTSEAKKMMKRNPKQ